MSGNNEGKDIKNTPEVEDKEIEEYKKLCQVFYKLENKGLPIKDASYGRVRVEYIRGKDLQQYIEENKDWLCTEINSICGTKINPQSASVLQLIYAEFNTRGMLLKAQKYEEDTKIKYPKRILPFEEEDGCSDKKSDKQSHKHHNIDPVQMSLFDPMMCYVVYVERDEKKTYFWLIVAVVVVLGFCLFPVWPIELKIGIWWVSYILLLIMIGLIIVRLLIYTLFYIFGIDVWLFPNLFDEKVINLFNFF
jgi:translocation protein SEC62